MNVKIRYKCPYCGRSIEHNPAYAGSLVVCSACLGEFYEPTDPLPGRAADKAPARKSASAKPPIPRNPIGYDPNAGGDVGETPTAKAPETKTPETKAPAPSAPAAAAPATAPTPSGPRIKEPKSSQPKDSESPLGGSLWAQVSGDPKPKQPATPASARPAKMTLPTSGGSSSGNTSQAKPSPTAAVPAKPASALPAKPAASIPKAAAPAAAATKPAVQPAAPEVDDEDIDFQAIISSELNKPKSAAPTPAAKSPPTAKTEVPSKPVAPTARPATASSPAGAVPQPRPTAPAATTPHSGGHSLHTATPTDMANELRRRGLFGAIVFGDPTKPDQAQLALSDNMTRDDAKSFITKLFAVPKPTGEEPKSGGMFGRLFGGGKES